MEVDMVRAVKPEGYDESCWYQWLEAVNEVALEEVMPSKFGGQNGGVEVLALVGDAHLRSAVLDEIYLERGTRQSVSFITRILSVSVANKTLAKHVWHLVPKTQNVLRVDRVDMMEKDIGTLVEAAICLVKQQNKPGAMKGLAQYLLKVAYESSSDASNVTGVITIPGPNGHNPNGMGFQPKAILIELGGSVSATWKMGTPSHAPIFLGKASLHGITAEGEGPTKKSAETCAAATLFRKTKINQTHFKMIKQGLISADMLDGASGSGLITIPSMEILQA